MVDVTQADIDRIKADLRRELLQDLNPPNPVPPVPPTPPIPVTPQETWWQQVRPLLTPIILVLLTIIGTIGVQQKWWTAEQFQKFQQVIVDQQTGETTTVTTMTPVSQSASPDKHNIILRKPDGTTTAITKPNQAIETTAITANTTPATQSVQSATTDQIKQWMDIFLPVIKQVIQDLKPAPAPVPIDPPKPKPVDPIVTPPTPPIPIPDPSATLKLILTDEQQKPVTSMTIPTNQIITVTLSGATGKVVWNVTTVGNVSDPMLPQNLGYSIELREPSAWASIHAVDLGSGQSVSARVTALTAPQPPPVIDQTNVVPVNPPKPSKNLTEVTLIYSPGSEPPYLAKIIGNHSWWANTYGSKWKMLTAGTKSPKGQQAIAFAQTKQINPPFLAVWSDGDALVDVKPVPQTVDQIPTVVNGALQ